MRITIRWILLENFLVDRNNINHFLYWYYNTYNPIYRRDLCCDETYSESRDDNSRENPVNSYQ